MKWHISIFAILLGLILISGCKSTKYTLADRTENNLKREIESNNESIEKLDKIAADNERSYQNSNINESTYTEIKEYVDVEKKKIEESTKILEDQLGKLQGKVIVKKEDLDDSKAVIEKNKAILEEIFSKANLVDDMLSSELSGKTEIGAIFGLGQYQLNDNQRKKAIQTYKPVIDKMYHLIEKHHNVISQFKGEIEIVGYSDETVIQKGSTLYNELMSYFSDESPTNKDLNKTLSELRSESIKGILQEMIDKKQKGSKNNITILVKARGEGENLPPGVTQRTSGSDPARRIVTFKWAVIPR